MISALSALALAAIALSACAYAAQNYSNGMIYTGVVKSFDPASLMSGCLYTDRWYANGAVVPTRAACLHCTCANSALSCRRRACRPIPSIVPPSCFVKLDPDACCSVLHCPDEIKHQKHFDEVTADTSMFTQVDENQVCSEDGTTYAAGSAMPSNIECKHCFCVKGVKRCVKPLCVEAPPDCVPLPSVGACCPQRYYCKQRNHNEKEFDCLVRGERVEEGEPVALDANCTTCFCLKGKVQCQELKCAPSMFGCEPLVRATECCAHQYACGRPRAASKQAVRGGIYITSANRKITSQISNHSTSHGEYTSIYTNYPRSNETSFTPKMTAAKNKVEQMFGNTPSSSVAERTQPFVMTPQTKMKVGSTTVINLLKTRGRDAWLHEDKQARPKAEAKIVVQKYINSTTTFRPPNQIKYSHRHTEYTPPIGGAPISEDLGPTSKKSGRGHTDYIVRHPILLPATNSDANTSSTKVKRKIEEYTLPSTKSPFDNGTIAITLQSTSTEENLLTTETTAMTTERTTEQPEGTVKIVINGTINCTAELSSTSLPQRVNLNDTEKIQMEAMPRVPIINGVEAQTYSPNDIITDRSVNGDFDENDTFTINVTSSLNANTKLNTNATAVSKAPVLVELADSANSSKKTKGDYDYDYTEPTLPPSLPNLKIIPFVAADAVIDDETSKEPLTYPILEREDKFPVYYPNNPKDTFTKGEDTYHPTQYPVFISEKEPVYTHDIDLTGNRYSVQNDLIHDYTMSTSLGSHANEDTTITKAPVSTSTFELETPAVNLFSPPIETEGGFIPKGPGIIDEYYAVYPSTPSGPQVPHLTTSMQLDISKGECISDGGIHIPDGDTITIECRDCICSWGRLSCAPTICQAPVGCDYMPVTEDSVDRCCGDIVCHTNNKTASTISSPVSAKDKTNETKLEIAIENVTATNKVDAYQTTKMPQTTASLPANITKVIKINNDQAAEKQTTRIPTTTPSIINITEALKMNTEFATASTTASSTSTTKPFTKITTTTTSTTKQQVNDTEYEDDEDEGFSLGSVLQLLLSDTYETTTTKKPKTSKPPTRSPQTAITSTRRPPSTVSKFQPVSTVKPFIPLPVLPYFPPKMSPSSVNRIDHLVLGEATAIKRTTVRPITNKTTKRPIEWHTEKTDVDSAFTSGPRPPNLSNSPGHGLISVGVGIFKLAGCNIYGRMYRVGRIIAELSTPCQECWCTELGVQCKSLKC